MKLTARERKDILLALMLASDTEASFADAHSKTILRKGNLVRVIKREDRQTVRRALRRVDRFDALFNKIRRPDSRGSLE